MVTDTKLQERNASAPIEVTLFGMLIEVKPLQPKNAPCPIEVMPFGMVMEVKLVHTINA